MSLLAEIVSIADACNIPVETGAFSDNPPAAYMVVTPLNDSFELHSDNAPEYEIGEARLSLFIQGNYTGRKNTIVRSLLAADFTITERRYIEYEKDTGYHHYAIDVAKAYQFQLETEE